MARATGSGERRPHLHHALGYQLVVAVAADDRVVPAHVLRLLPTHPDLEEPGARRRGLLHLDRVIVV